MSRWKFRSLEWIHRVRAENYSRTKGEYLKRDIEDSVKRAKRHAAH